MTRDIVDKILPDGPFKECRREIQRLKASRPDLSWSWEVRGAKVRCVDLKKTPGGYARTPLTSFIYVSQLLDWLKEQK